MTPLGVVNIAKNTTGVGENTLNLKKGSFSFFNNGNATPPPAEFTLP